MAETNSLLNCRTRKGTGGSNPPLSARIFWILLFVFWNLITGYSVVRLSRLLWEQEVASSNLATPTLEDQHEMLIFFFAVYFFVFHSDILKY